MVGERVLIVEIGFWLTGSWKFGVWDVGLNTWIIRLCAETALGIPADLLVYSAHAWFAHRSRFKRECVRVFRVVGASTD